MNWPKQQRKCKTKQGTGFLGNIMSLGMRALTSTGLIKKGLAVGVKSLNSKLGKN